MNGEMRHILHLLTAAGLVGGLLLGWAGGPPVAADAAPVCFGKTPAEWTALGYTVRVGTAGNDKLIGTWKAEVLIGLGGNDVINGSGGSDVICGGDGNDRLWGGDGDDSIDAGAGVDLIDAGAGSDIILAGDGGDTIQGSSGDDLIIGGAGNDIIRGGPGNDLIDARLGNDSVYGDDGDDLLVGAEGDDRIWGGSGKDVLVGDCFPLAGQIPPPVAARLVALGNAAPDLATETCASFGGDALDGGVGADMIFGDALATSAKPVADPPTHAPGIICGTCVEYDNDVTAKVRGIGYALYGDGADRIQGSNGGGGEALNVPERLYGGGGDDIIDDVDGDEYAYGGAGNDRITGHWGTDYIYGGEGDDYCDGGGNNPGPLVDVAHGCETVLNVP